MGIISGGEVIQGAHERIRRASGALTPVDTAGGVFAWQNPEDQAILVRRVSIDVTTATAGACTVDAGPAADGTTLNDTAIDGLDVGAAAVLGDNIRTPGTNGLESFRVAANGGAADWITGSVASGASAGIVGRFQIEYTLEGE